jgi:hypothetical protein
MHRRTAIERSSGLRESLIHALMMAEISVPVVLVLLCEVNPALLALCASAGLVREGTAVWDVRAAVDGGREVRPAEQHIHSFLESLPFMAISALLCLHWAAVPALGPGGGPIAMGLAPPAARPPTPRALPRGRGGWGNGPHRGALRRGGSTVRPPGPAAVR